MPSFKNGWRAIITPRKKRELTKLNLEVQKAIADRENHSEEPLEMNGDYSPIPSQQRLPQQQRF